MQFANDQISNLTAALATQVSAFQAADSHIVNMSSVLNDLRAQMAAAEWRSAGSTSLTSPDTPMLTIVALALAAVALFVLLMLALMLWFRRSPVGIKNIAISPTPLATWDTEMYSTAGGLPVVQSGDPGNPNEARHRSDTSRGTGANLHSNFNGSTITSTDYL